MFHGHLSVAEACDIFLVMVVGVEAWLYVGPGPSPLLRTYPESGSRELGGIRSDQVVGRTTKAKKIPGTRNMRKISEKMVTMTHAGICWVKQESVW